MYEIILFNIQFSFNCMTLARQPKVEFMLNSEVSLPLFFYSDAAVMCDVADFLSDPIQSKTKDGITNA